MTNPEPSIRVNVDPTNPGQFFACCGFLELADRLWRGAEGWFEEPREFCIAAGGVDLADLIADVSRARADPTRSATTTRPPRSRSARRSNGLRSGLVAR